MKYYSMPNDDTTEDKNAFDILIDDIEKMREPDDYSFAIGLRGINKSDIGKRELKESRVWIDGSSTKEILPGTSAIVVVNDWDGASRDDLLLGFYHAMHRVAGYGNTDIVAIVKGSHNTGGEDADEIILGDATVIGYIKKITQ